MEEQLSILRPYLKHALTTGRKGVNFFLYGDPGTGKTQLLFDEVEDAFSDTDWLPGMRGSGQR